MSRTFMRGKRGKPKLLFIRDIYRDIYSGRFQFRKKKEKIREEWGKRKTEEKKERKDEKGKKRREKREAKNGIVVKKRENILFPCFIKALMTAIKSPQKNREEFQGGGKDVSGWL